MKNIKRFSMVFILSNLFSFSLFAGSNKVLLKEKLTTNLDLKEIFFASPVIYSILITLSVVAFTIWLYCLFTFRLRKNLNQKTIKSVKNYLTKKDFSKALTYCKNQESLFSRIVASGITARTHGPQYITDTMKSAGMRHTTKFWQRIALLNDIVVVAPMLGLLGTVVGMFYAFYDINRSIDSIASLFDGLGIAIGTTVAGLVVALVAMIFHATLKYKLITMLNTVESEAVSMSSLIHPKTRRKS